MLSFQILLTVALCGSLSAGMSGGAFGLCEDRPSSDEAERYRAVVEFQVGDLDGPLALTRVDHIAVIGPRVYVSQPVERRIRVLSAETGELVDEWAGPGEGPGEFGALTWMGVIDGMITALDHRLGRVTTFDRDGEVVEVRRIRAPSPTPPYVFTSWMFATADGHGISLGDVLASQSVGAVESTPVLLTTDEGGVVIEFRPADAGRKTVVLRSGGNTRVFSRPLHWGARLGMAPDGTMFVVTGGGVDGSLTLYRYDARRQVADTVHTTLAPVTVPEAVSDSVRQVLHDRVLSGSSGPSGAVFRDLGREQVESATWVPDAIPAVDELFVSPHGDVWLRAPNFGDMDDVWHVVGEGGEVRAEVEVPHGTVLMSTQGEALWGVRLHPDFDVPTVLRMRLERVD